MRPFTLALLTVLTGTPAAVQAARPFVTDDARLTNGGTCQVESWARHYRHSNEAWALLGCNPTGNLEFTLGGGHARAEQQPGSNDHILQLKTLVQPLQTNGSGWGLAVGWVRHVAAQPGPNQWGNTYAYVPGSWSFRDDRVIVHANLGWLRQRRTGQHSLSWGLGAEWTLTARLQAIAESFGDHRSQPFWQAGMRYGVLPGLLQVDATVGSMVQGPDASRWLSIGLRFTPEAR